MGPPVQRSKSFPLSGLRTALNAGVAGKGGRGQMAMGAGNQDRKLMISVIVFGGRSCRRVANLHAGPVTLWPALRQGTRSKASRCYKVTVWSNSKPGSGAGGQGSKAGALATTGLLAGGPCAGGSGGGFAGARI